MELFSQEAEFKPDYTTQQRGIQLILDNPSAGMIWVVEYQGQVVGMVSLLFSVSTALGAPVATLEDFVVTSKLRGQGLGQTLLTSALEFAHKAGYKRITLLTDGDNLKAQVLYQKLGFTLSNMKPMRKVI